MKGLAVILTIWIAVADSQVDASRRRGRRHLDECRTEGHIEACAENHGIPMSIDEVFDLMADNPYWLTSICHGWELLTCVMGCCEDAFSASKYGYMYNMCFHKRTIMEQRQCWDEDFPEQARQCYHLRHYPSYRQGSLYPIPIRVYDQSSIARDCFPNDSHVCKYYKSYMLDRMMPRYYLIFNYPARFNHTEFVL